MEVARRVGKSVLIRMYVKLTQETIHDAVRGQKDPGMTLPWTHEGESRRKKWTGVLGEEDFQMNENGDGPAEDGVKKRYNDFKLLMATGRMH